MRFTPLIIATLAFAPLTAQEEVLSFTGQVRSRSMAIKSTENSLFPIHHELRSRTGITGRPARDVTIHVELQDSRNFGSESLGPVSDTTAPHTATLANSRGIDLHQGYFQVKANQLDLKVGRQKIALGSQRFISSLEWHPNARVFDAALATVDLNKQLRLTVLSSVVRDTAPLMEDGFLTLSGAHMALKVSDKLGLEAYGFLDYSGEMLRDYILFNAGIRLNGAVDMIYFDEEFQYQGGDRQGADVVAFFNATRVGINFNPGYKVGLGLDMMSGTADGSGGNTYAANYFFGHAYFGWMDQFLSNPPTGVIDLLLELEIPINRKFMVKSQGHYFLQANSSSDNENPYGMEFDLEVHAKLFAKSNIVLGGGVFLPQGGPGISNNEFGALVYLMPTFNF